MVLQLFPRDAALGQLLTYPSDIAGELHTLIMGVDYAARRDVFVADYEPIGVPGAPWPDAEPGETVDTDSSQLLVAIPDATVAFFVDAAAGASRVAGGPNRVQHAAGATVFAGPDRSVIVPYDVVVGDRVYLSDGASELFTTVVDLLWVGGEPVTLVLADNVPLTMAATFDITVARPRLRVLDDTEYLAAVDELSIEDALEADIVDGGTTYPIIAWPGASRVTVSYRARRVDNIGEPIMVQSAAQLSLLFVGSEYPESGLGFAVRRAWFDAQNSPGVLAVAVSDESTAAWQDEIDRVRPMTNWFAMAPVTNDGAVQALFIELMSLRRAAEYPAELFISLPLAPVLTLWTGSEVVTVDDSLTPGEDRTVTSSGVFAGAVSGSRVVIDDVAYSVVQAVSAQTVVVATSVAAGAFVLTAVETNRTVREQALELGGRAAAINNQDVFVVFPPAPLWNGEVVEPHHLCAAVAGLRGITVAQRPLTRLLLESGWLLPQPRWEFAGQLTLLRDSGVFVLSETPDLYNPHVLYDASTAPTSSQTCCEAMVANISVALRQFKLLVLNYDGTFRATQAVFDRIRNQAVQLGEYLKTNTVVEPYGALIAGVNVGPVTEITPETDPGRIVLPLGLVVAALVRSVVLAVEITLATVNSEVDDG
jgi:hypothetical protein